MGALRIRQSEPQDEQPPLVIHSPEECAKPAPETREEGVRCPSCHCRHLPTLYTRHKGNRTERVRECRHCGRRVITRETITFSE